MQLPSRVHFPYYVLQYSGIKEFFKVVNKFGRDEYHDAMDVWFTIACDNDMDDMMQRVILLYRNSEYRMELIASVIGKLYRLALGRSDIPVTDNQNAACFVVCNASCNGSCHAPYTLSFVKTDIDTLITRVLAFMFERGHYNYSCATTRVILYSIPRKYYEQFILEYPVLGVY